MALMQSLISTDKYGLKCPYAMTPKGICIHNSANDASAKNEISYMKSNSNSTSFHIAIDDVESIQGIPFNRNAFAAGDGSTGDGNRNYIHIEICYSLSGGTRFINAEKRTAVEVAALLKRYGWTIKNVKKHQDFMNKYCPHRTLDLGWQRFLNMIQTELNKLNKPVEKEIIKEKVVDDKVKYFIQYGNDIDKRVVGYLEDVLKCGSMNAGLDYNYYSKVENLIAIGGVPASFGKFSGYTKYWIQGNDRWDTAEEVIKVARRLSKGEKLETVLQKFKVK